MELALAQVAMQAESTKPDSPTESNSAQDNAVITTTRVSTDERVRDLSRINNNLAKQAHKVKIQGLIDSIEANIFDKEAQEKLDQIKQALESHTKSKNE